MQVLGHFKGKAKSTNTEVTRKSKVTAKQINKPGARKFQTVRTKKFRQMRKS